LPAAEAEPTKHSRLLLFAPAFVQNLIFEEGATKIKAQRF